MKIYNFEGKSNLAGPKIKERRVQLNLSQDMLATKMQLHNIEISQKSISRIETQERFIPDYELFAFSEVLGVDIKWFFQ